MESPSTSLQLSENGALVVSSFVVTDVPLQDGASGTGVIVTLTLALALLTVPSLARYVTVSAPLALAFGTYVASEQLVIESIPFAPCVTTEQVRESPSTSLQLRENGALGVSSSVVTE